MQLVTHLKTFSSFAVLATIVFFGGCAQPGPMISGRLADTDKIESLLQRGKSLKGDVERILGKPNSYGKSLFPTQATTREVWVYVFIQTGEPRVSSGRTTTIDIDTRQQTLLIFFDGDKFDGYLWSLDAMKATAERR